MSILTIVPVKPTDTYYVKLCAEADPELLRTGTGRLFLRFYPDPVSIANCASTDTLIGHSGVKILFINPN